MTTSQFIILLTILVAIAAVMYFMINRRLQTFGKNIKQIDEEPKETFTSSKESAYVVESVGESLPAKSLKIIDEFSIYSDDNKENLKFTRIDSLPDPAIWSELSINNFTKTDLQNLMSGLQNFTTTSILAAQATNGLFKATGPLSQLMKINSGGYGSALLNNGKISGHAGFIKAGSPIFAPIIVFQLASMITAQYYLHGITKQLSNIIEKLDKLILFFHIERHARFNRSYFFLNELSKRKSFEIEDYVMLKSIIIDLTDIREEYAILLSTTMPELKSHMQKTFLRSKTEVESLMQKFEDIKFFETLEMSISADKLYHIAKLIELHMNFSFRNPDDNRIELINEKMQELSTVFSSDFQFHKSQKVFDEVKQVLLNKIDEIQKVSLTNSSAIPEARKTLEKRFNDFESSKKKDLIELQNIYKNTINLFSKTTEIIIDNTDISAPRIFCKK